MIIGNNNVFEVGSCRIVTNRWPLQGSFRLCSIDCEALKVGDNNVLECKGKSEHGWNEKLHCCFDKLARVGRHVTLTSGCVIGAKCSLTTDEALPENTVIFGADHQRRTMPDRPAVSISHVARHDDLSCLPFVLVSNASARFPGTHFTYFALCFETGNKNPRANSDLISLSSSLSQ